MDQPSWRTCIFSRFPNLHSLPPPPPIHVYACPFAPRPPPPWLPPSQVGEMVNLKDLTDDPGDANQLLWLGLDALTPPLPPSPPTSQVGVMVNLKDLTDDPGDANQLLWLGLDALTVLVHTICIWALALPLMLACIGFQVRGGGYYEGLAVFVWSGGGDACLVRGGCPSCSASMMLSHTLCIWAP